MPSADRDQEKALLFSEARFRALFLDNPTMVVTLDTKWTILSVNPSCTAQLGYKIDELEGQSGLNLFLEDDRAAVAEELRRCLENPNKVYRWTFRKVHKDGRVLWVEETAQAVYDLNGALNVMIVCQDVTERKRAEEALKNSEEMLSYAAIAANIGIWRWDAINQQLNWSERCMEFFGYPPDHPMTYEAFLHPIHEDDRQRVDDAFQKALQEKTEFNVELRVIWPDGQVRWVLKKGRGFYDDQGKPISMHGITMDITERKRMEEVINRLNASLAERANELEAINKEQETFNHTVAHDLRQPLNILSSYCQVIDKICGDQLQEECKGYIRDAYKVTLRMNRLIEALLNFSHMSRVEPRRELVDLSLLAQEVSLSLKMTELERQVDFRITERMLANGDANLLRAVVDNLLGNAWKYTGMREVAIIEFGVTHIDGVPTYFVRDNGIGFDMVNADKIFAPFQRLPGDEKRRGLGIGLATVERIIRRHGGKVWAEGEPDKGACIYFTLSAD